MTKAEEREAILDWINERQRALFIAGESFRGAAIDAGQDLGFAVGPRRMSHLCDAAARSHRHDYAWRGYCRGLHCGRDILTAPEWERVRIKLATMADPLRREASDFVAAVFQRNGLAFVSEHAVAEMRRTLAASKQKEERP